MWGGEKQGGGGVNVKCRREERKREGSGATLGKRKGSRSIQFGVSVPGTDAHCWMNAAHLHASSTYETDLCAQTCISTMW